MMPDMILQTLLAGAFSAKELAFLRRDLRFATALEHVYTAQDFERLRRIGKTVLAERERAQSHARKAATRSKPRPRAAKSAPPAVTFAPRASL
jgi:hypothetical protein